MKSFNKVFISAIFLIGFWQSAKSQGILTPTGMGVNISTPDPSAALDVTSTTKGALIPRMTQAQRDAITSPATGLIIFQINPSSGFYYYNGAAWTSMGGGSNGLNGLKSLVKISSEPAGPNCPVAGAKIESGIDLNNNNILVD